MSVDYEGPFNFATRWSTQSVVNVVPYLVSTMSRYALVSMSDAAIEQLKDGEGDQNISRDDLTKLLADVKVEALEFLKDSLKDLEAALEEEMQKIDYSVIVKRVDYNDDGSIKDIAAKAAISDLVIDKV